MFHSRNMVHDYSRASHPSSPTSGVCLLQFEKPALTGCFLREEREEGGETGGKEREDLCIGEFMHWEGCYKTSHMEIE